MINKIYIEYLLLKEDKASFHQVLRLIQPSLLTFATSLLKDESLAQDAVQDALMAIVKGVRKLKDHKKFHAWIYQITRNKCFDMIRKNQKYSNDSSIDSTDELIAATKTEDQLDMISLIKQLPHKQKSIIQLFYYDGFNIREIAEILQKPAGTVKSLLFDARNQLKQLFGE
ncbi:MAG: RNA polymerase sigma factor [Proteobacteria bacterium]|nr:RNA polymerase sigma factor [Pseudomonadota bacterium]